MLRSVCKLNCFRPEILKCAAAQVKYLSDSSGGTKSSKKNEEEIKITGLAKALGKFRELEKNVSGTNESPPPPPADERSFLTLLRNSEFVQMGEPKGKIVVGRIFQVVNTDLYIDFGGKFYCVCRKPKRSSELYVRNAQVKLRINELELCARFLGATEDLTLTEASGTILDLISTPVSKENVIERVA